MQSFFIVLLGELRSSDPLHCILNGRVSLKHLMYLEEIDFLAVLLRLMCNESGEKRIQSIEEP